MAMLDLTDADYNQILLNRFHNPYITCKKAELSPTFNDNGLMGDHFLLKIYYQLDDIEQYETFFIKTIHMAKYKDTYEAYKKQYQKEIFFYEFLMKEFEKLGLDTSFAPKCYLTKGEETLVLENLQENQFYVKDKYTKFNMEELKSGLDCLAALHGCSIIFELERSKEEPGFRIDQKYPKIFNKSRGLLENEWYTTSITLWIKLIDDYLKDEDLKNKLKERNWGQVETNDFRKVVTHGDLWPNNVLFKRLNTKGIKVNLVDYQIAMYSYPAYDILCFIYFNTEQDLRTINILELFDHYYEKLSGIVHRQGYQIEGVLPKDELIRSIDFVKYSAIFHVVSSHPFTSLPESAFANLSKNINHVVSDSKYELVTNTMKECEQYKKIILQCLEYLQIVFEDTLRNNKN